LEYLMRNAGRVVTKTMILEHIWDYSFDPQTNVVDVLVHRLRNRWTKTFLKRCCTPCVELAMSLSPLKHFTRHQISAEPLVRLDF